MADADASGKEMFRRSTMNRVASSEELDHYIKVTNPSAWVVVLAALLLVGGVVAWAIAAVVPVTVETTGVLFEDPASGDPVVVCWVDKATASRVKTGGLKVSVDNVEAKDAKMSDIPSSASEVVESLGSDFYADSIKLDDWNYQVVIVPGAVPNSTDFTIGTAAGKAHLVPVSIVTSETRPINIVLGK